MKAIGKPRRQTQDRDTPSFRPIEQLSSPEKSKKKQTNDLTSGEQQILTLPVDAQEIHLVSPRQRSKDGKIRQAEIIHDPLPGRRSKIDKGATSAAKLRKE